MSRYAQSALERETQAIVSTGEGGRRNQVNASSFSAGQLVGAGVLEMAQAEDALLEAALSTGLELEEAKKTVRDGLNDGAKNPRDLSRVGSGAGRVAYSSAYIPKPHSSSKAEQAGKWRVVTDTEFKTALEGCIELQDGSKAWRDLEGRGLLEAVQSGNLAVWERSSDGALVFAITDPDGQIMGLKIRKFSGKQRYEYLVAGHGTPPLCFSSGHKKVIVQEGELNGAALAAVVRHSNLEYDVCGVAGSESIPHPAMLEGREVWLSADPDTAGQKALKGWAALAFECGAVSVNIMPMLETGDPCNLLGGQGMEAATKWLEGALEQATPASEPALELSLEPPAEVHPTLSPEALHGLAGELVEVLEPSTEADPAAVLLTFLITVSALYGDKFFIQQGGRHPLRIWAVLVGTTAKGRKGTSWQAVKLVLEKVLPEGWQLLVKPGLSSGEGLIYAVRDPIYKTVKNKDTGALEEQLVDGGVSDKRVLVKEEEFGSVLKVMLRESNTLSAVLRSAWDLGGSDILQVMTKNSPNTATGAHIGILGHITKDELLRHLEDTEAANGFANRFLWLLVKRSKILPFGGIPDEVALEALAVKMRLFITWAGQQGDGRLEWSEDGRAAWAAVYGALSGEIPGMAGALLARAEAQVLRMAGLYAVLNRSREISAEHLGAALAVWEYCEDSSTGIFGGRFGDPIADALLKELRQEPEGLSKSELSNLLGRNASAARLETALNLLLSSGRVQVFERKAVSGKGRPAQVYRARG